MKLEELVFDKSSRIYIPRSSGSPTAYQDGSEEYLESVLKKHSYVGIDSLELRDSINGWASLYHFSAYRPTIVDCFEFTTKEAQVLELGAGCGGVTRWLGETFSEVIAVEGSHKRAEIARLRCKDLDTVKVYGVNIYDLEIDEVFDLVTLIGVVEYSHLFHPTPGISPRNGALSLLKFAYNSLKPSGILLLAIENQLGLKYFSGSCEDHSGKIFHGLHGYPDSTSAVTYSARELESLLRRAGFARIDFFLAFPDYKLASTILNASLIEPDYHLHNWVETPFPDRTRPDRTLLFNESLVIRELQKARLLKDLANSFVILAYKEGFTEKTKPIIPYEQTWIARHYSLDRHPKFWKKTSLVWKNGKKLLVESSQPFTSMGRGDLISAPFRQFLTQENFYVGDLLLYSIFEMIEGERFQDKFLGLLSKFSTFLNQHFRESVHSSESGIPLLRGDALDISFWNIIVESKTGEWRIIDKEWNFVGLIPADFILCRNLIHFSTRYAAYLRSHLKGKRPEDFIFGCVQKIYPDFTMERFKLALEFERAFQHFVRTGEVFDKHASLLESMTSKQFTFLGPMETSNLTVFDIDPSVFSKTAPDPSARKRPMVSIIVWSSKGDNRIEKCLATLRDCTLYQPYEIITANDHGINHVNHTEESEEKLQPIASKKKKSFGINCNQAAKKARGEFLLFIRSDTMVTKGWLTQLVKTMLDEPLASIVGGKILYPDDTIQHAGIIFDKNHHIRYIYHGLPDNHPNTITKREFQAVSKTCMLVKKDMFYQVQGFDEINFPGFENIDLCLKLKEQGQKIIYCPDSIVYTSEPKTSEQFLHSIKLPDTLIQKWDSKIVPDDEKIAKEDKLAVIYDSRSEQSYLIHDIKFIKKLQKSGKHSTAMAVLEQTKKIYEECDTLLESDYYLIMKELWNVYLILNKLSEAREILDVVVDLAKKFSGIDEATKLLSEFLKYQPLDFDALHKYGETCAEAGDFKGALSSIEKILIFQPGREDTLKLKQKITSLPD